MQSPRVRVHGVSWEEGSVGEAQTPELNSQTPTGKQTQVQDSVAILSNLRHGWIP